MMMESGEFVILCQKVGAAMMMRQPPIPVENVRAVMLNLDMQSVQKYLADNRSVIHYEAATMGLNELLRRAMEGRSYKELKKELDDIMRPIVPVPRVKKPKRTTEPIPRTTTAPPPSTSRSRAAQQQPGDNRTGGQSTATSPAASIALATPGDAYVRPQQPVLPAEPPGIYLTERQLYHEQLAADERAGWRDPIEDGDFGEGLLPIGEVDGPEVNIMPPMPAEAIGKVDGPEGNIMPPMPAEAPVVVAQEAPQQVAAGDAVVVPIDSLSIARVGQDQDASSAPVLVAPPPPVEILHPISPTRPIAGVLTADQLRRQRALARRRQRGEPDGIRVPHVPRLPPPGMFEIDANLISEIRDNLDRIAAAARPTTPVPPVQVPMPMVSPVIAHGNTNNAVDDGPHLNRAGVAEAADEQQPDLAVDNVPQQPDWAVDNVPQQPDFAVNDVPLQPDLAVNDVPLQPDLAVDNVLEVMPDIIVTDPEGASYQAHPDHVELREPPQRLSPAPPARSHHAVAATTPLPTPPRPHQRIVHGTTVTLYTPLEAPALRLLSAPRGQRHLVGTAVDAEREHASAHGVVAAVKSADVRLRVGSLLRAAVGNDPTGAVTAPLAFRTVVNMHNKELLRVQTTTDGANAADADVSME